MGWRSVHILVFALVVGMCMDSRCMYSEEINKMSIINEEHESSSLVRKEDCNLEFTTDKVKCFTFIYVYEL